MSDGIFTLDAEIRTDLGKGASRRLRHAGKVPAVLYGADKEAVSLTLTHNKVFQAQEFEAFYSHVLTLNIDGEKVEALVKDMQRHAFKPLVMHLDFLRVDAKTALQTHVPLHFINEAKAESIKTLGGHAEHHMVDVEVSCLPSDLPEFIEVDLTNVELGQTLHLTDLVLPKGVSLVELNKGESHDLAVVTVKLAKGPKVEDDDSAEEEDNRGISCLTGSTDNSIQLIVGLGNPGPEYQHTRHNAGWWFVESLAKAHNCTLKLENKFFGYTGRIVINGQDIRLLIPTTFMNKSGQAVAAMAKFYRIPISGLLVAFDELDLPPGVAKFKTGGSSSQNGIRDIVSKMANNREFLRLRIGIGHPGDKSRVTGHVLGKAPQKEQQQIEDAIDEATRCTDILFKDDLKKAMNRLHSFKAE